jgi:transposase
MIAVSAQTRIWVAREPADFRCGIDGLAKICRAILKSDPFSGALFVFRNRRAKSIKILAYNGRGFWLCQKRLSKGRFRWWPESDEACLTLEAHQLQLLLAGGDPAAAKGAAVWRSVQEKPQLRREGTCVPE